MCVREREREKQRERKRERESKRERGRQTEIIIIVNKLNKLGNQNKIYIRFDDILAIEVKWSKI